MIYNIKYVVKYVNVIIDIFNYNINFINIYGCFLIQSIHVHEFEYRYIVKIAYHSS